MSVTPFFRFAVGDAADFNAGVVWQGQDFTGASMTLTVSARPAAGGAALLTADTDSGRIRIRSDGAGFDYMVPQAALEAVPLGLQKIQQTVTQDGVTKVLFTGTWSRVPGGTNDDGQELTYDGFSAPIEFGDATPVVALRTEGQPGASAYDLWLEAGNSGDMTDFLNALKLGPPGPQGAPGAIPSVIDGGHF